MRSLSAGLLALVASLEVAAAAPVELNVFEWEGYISPHAQAFQAFARAKGKDVKLRFLTKPDGSPHYIASVEDIYDAVRAGRADVVTPTNNYFKDGQGRLLRVLQPIDTARLAHWGDLPERLRGAQFAREGQDVFAVPLLGGTYGLAYNADRVKEPPTSWTALWDPRYAGRISVTGAQYEANFYVAALVAGAKPADVYSHERVDMAKVKALANGLVKNSKELWDGNPNVESMAKDLDLITDYWFGVAIANGKGQNWKLARPKEGETVWLDTMSIARQVASDPAKLEAAHLLLDFMIAPQAQAEIVKAFGSVVVNPKARTLLTPAQADASRVGDESFFREELFWQPLDVRTRNVFKNAWIEAIKASGRSDLMLPK